MVINLVMMNFSLLDDPLIRVRTTDGFVRYCTLPEVFALLVQENVWAFEALQVHQKQPWHSFLVQLAAMGIAREAGGVVPSSPERWRDVLLALAQGQETAWCLVVDNPALPAFMQPPAPEGSLQKAGYKQDVPTPDRLDVLITSKNHDLKAQRISRPRPEHWLFALVTLQTMEGFLGRGNYGIVRMNGGFGSRPQVGLSKELTWGAHFRRDLKVLLQTRTEAAAIYDPDGFALLWLESWDGGKKSAISLESCDPYFIEICRRIRFTVSDGRMFCWRANTEGQRIYAPEGLNGKTGDPWSPVDTVKSKVLTVSESGFTYKLLQQILFGDYAHPMALTFQEDERNGAYLVARALVRGQGTTDGLAFRVVRINNPASRVLFGKRDDLEVLAARSRQRVELAAEVQRKILYPAVAALVGSGRDEKVDAEKVSPWTDAFDRAVDVRFFDALWESVELDGEEARRQWEQTLWDETFYQFEKAEQSIPMASIHHWKARTKARSILFGRKQEILKSLTDVPSHVAEEIQK